MKGYSTEDKAIVEITDVLRKAIHKKREERKKKKGRRLSFTRPG